jgi:hypothetical protein
MNMVRSRMGKQTKEAFTLTKCTAKPPTKLRTTETMAALFLVTLHDVTPIEALLFVSCHPR